MNNTLLTIITSVVVPILVALISSGKMATFVTKRMKLEDLNSKVDNLSDKVDILTEKVEIVDKKVDKVDDQEKEDQAMLKRTQILRFNGEVMRGVHHNKEEFDNCIETIDKYEKYCEEHPDFPNDKCHFAIGNIHRVYKECLENNSF